MVFITGLAGPFVFGSISTGAAGAGFLLKPLAFAAFAVPTAGTMPLTIIAASI